MFENSGRTVKSALKNFWSSPWTWMILTPVALFATDSGRKARQALGDLGQWALAEFEIFRNNLRFYRWIAIYPATVFGLWLILSGGSSAPIIGTLWFIIAWLPAVLSSIVIGAVANDSKREGGNIGQAARVVWLIIRPLQIICWIVLMAFTIAFFFVNPNWSQFAIFLLYTEIIMTLALSIILLGKKIESVYVLAIILLIVVPVIYFAVFQGTDLGQSLTAFRRASTNLMAGQFTRGAINFQEKSLNLIVADQRIGLYRPDSEPKNGRAPMILISYYGINPGDTLLVGDPIGLEATNGGPGKWIGVYLRNENGVYLGRMYYLPPNSKRHAVFR